MTPLSILGTTTRAGLRFDSRSSLIWKTSQCQLLGLHVSYMIANYNDATNIFFRFWNVILELAGANNVLICTDEKVGIVNSVIKVWLIVTNDSSIYIFLISHFLGFPRYPKSSLSHPRLEKSESLFEEKWCCVQTRSRKLP